MPSVSLPPATTNPSPAPGESPLPTAGQGSPGTSPGASGSPGPSGSGTTGETVRIAAENIAFDTDQMQAPAGKAFVIEFENRDAGIPHNVEIKDAANQQIFLGEIFNGPGARTYHVPAIGAGVYTFVCTVHPNMTGTLTTA